MLNVIELKPPKAWRTKVMTLIELCLYYNHLNDMTARGLKFMQEF